MTEEVLTADLLHFINMRFLEMKIDDDLELMYINHHIL